MLNDFMPSTVCSKLSQTQVLIPISHVRRDEVTQDHLYDSVCMLNLTISLRMARSRHVPSDTQAERQGIVESSVANVVFGALFLRCYTACNTGVNDCSCTLTSLTAPLHFNF